MTEDWKKGVLAAAEIADDYNSSTTHPYRLGDCVAGKLNVRRGKARPNKEKLQQPADALTQGICLALAEMHRLHGDSSGVCEVARAAGITIQEAKQAGTNPYDWKELRRAGVQAASVRVAKPRTKGARK